MVHNPSDFRPEYQNEEERALEGRLLEDRLYPLIYKLISKGDELNARKALYELKTRYSSPDFELEELSWLEDLVELGFQGNMEGTPKQVVLNLKAERDKGKGECQRPRVNHAYSELLVRNYHNPFAWTELGKIILNASDLSVIRPDGEERSVPKQVKAQESLFFFDQALFLDQRYVDAYMSKAEALFSMGRILEATECFLEAKKSLTPLDKAAREYVKNDKAMFDITQIILQSANPINGVPPQEILEKTKKLLAAGILSALGGTDGLASTGAAGTLEDNPIYISRAYDLLSQLDEGSLTPEQRAESSYYKGVALKNRGSSIEVSVKCLEEAAALDPDQYGDPLGRPFISRDYISAIKGLQTGSSWINLGSHILSDNALGSSWSKKDKMTVEEKIRYAQRLLASGIVDSEKKESKTKQAQYVLYLARKTPGNSDELKSEIAYYTAIANQLIGQEEKAKEQLRESVKADPNHPLAQKRLTDIELEELMQQAETEHFDVTYVIPSYNSPKVEVRKTLDNLLKEQRFSGSIEIIYVDDGSTEGATAEFVRSKYAEYVERGNLKVLKVPNGGAGNARNYGIKIFNAGNSPYLAFFDSHDPAPPDRTQQLFDYMQAHPDVGVVHAKANFIFKSGIDKNLDMDPDLLEERDENDSPVAKWWGNRWKEADKVGLAMFRAYSCAIANITTMLTRKTVEKAGYQNVVWKRAQDMMYWGSVFRGGAEVGFLDKKVTNYRLNARK